MIQDYDKWRKKMGMKPVTPPAIPVVINFLNNLFKKLFK